MIRSMTGFGAGSAAEGAIAVRVEARSVNHRHLLVKLRVPSEHAALEAEIEARVRGKLDRGAVTLSVDVQRRAGAALARVDVEAARRYRDELEKLAQELGIARAIEIDRLILLPGVLIAPERDGAVDLEIELVWRALDAAVNDLLAMREREGASLQKELVQHAAEIRKTAAQIGMRAPHALEEQRVAFEERVRNLLARSTLAAGARDALDPSVLAREVALLSDKMDAREELVRLASHLEQLDKLLGSRQPVGRQLDFLSQELFREANTLGSKANDAALAHLVVELKTWIERLREQVQNVE